MYESFYGLTGKPFQLNPDASFFFASSGHERAFSYLKYGVFQREGFIVITGDVGAGKTTLVQALLEQLDQKEIVAVRLMSTQLDEDDLLRSIAVAFGVPPGALDKARLLAALEAFLASLLLENKRALLIVDEAQNLKARALEELRMLSNLQLADRALLQSFLVGQPELRELLRSPSMQQLGQRVIASYHLGPLDEDETHGYIEHRLRHVGWSGDPAFEPSALRVIYRASGGIPRRINTFCNRLMLAGCLNEQHAFDDAAAQVVADEIGEETAGALPPSPTANGGASPASPAPEWAALVARLEAVEKSVAALVGVREASAPRAPPKVVAARPRVVAPRGALLCVLDARSSCVKVAPLLRALRAERGLPPALLLHTGRADDVALGRRLLDELALPMPELNLGAGAGSPALQIADAMQRLEPIFDDCRPSCVIVVGDSDAALACALAGAKRHVPVVQAEAGVRSHDRARSGEINRGLIDQLAELLYAPARAAVATLEREGRHAHFVGNLAIDALHAALPKALPAGELLAQLGISGYGPEGRDGFGIVALRAVPSADAAAGLTALLDLLRQVSARIPLLWPMDPPLRAGIDRLALAEQLERENIKCPGPQRYLQMLGLLRGARLVLTDCDDVQQNTTALGVPCLTLLANTDQQVTVDEGTNTLVGSDAALTLRLVEDIVAGGGKRDRIPELWDGRAAARIAGHLAAWLAKRRTGTIEAAA